MTPQRPAIGTTFIALAIVLLIVIATVSVILLTSQQGTPGQSSTTSSSTSGSVSAITTTSYSSSSAASSLTGNESFQFVQASVGNLGNSIAVNATYRSNLPVSGAANLVGIAYPADVGFIPVTGGAPYGPICCPLVRSYSQSGFEVASTKINPNAHAQFSSVLLFPSLNQSSYLVKLYITSPSGSGLSPLSDLYLQISSGTVSGGQAGTGPTFFNQDNGLVYIADSGVDSITVVNGSTNRVVATISLPDIIGNLEFYLYDHGNHQLYVGAQESAEVFAIDTSTNYIVSKMITSQPNQSLQSMIYDPMNGKIFGINFVYSMVSVINDSTDRTVANITGIQAPLSGFYDPKSNELLVSAYNGTVFAINADTDKVTGKVPTSASIFLYDPDNQLLYASSGENIVALDASTFQQVGPAISLSNSPGSFVMYDSFNKDIYLYSGQGFESVGGDLIAISTQSDSVVASIPVPGLNEGLVIEEPSFQYDQINGNIYATEVSNPQNGTIGLLSISASSNTIISQTFPPKMPLNDISLDAKDGMLYGAYGAGSSTVFGLDLQSGAVATIVVGTSQAYGLAP